MRRGSVVALGMAAILAVTPAVRAQADLYELETFRNLAYIDGADADPVRHRLDLYRPRGCEKFPVVFFVHGGGWIQGHKDHLSLYSLMGRTLARQGIGMVSPNYRLTPQVKHPEHIRDVARAFAWTHKNIAKYGGDPALMFVGGHSAGGHLSALLATDESYLRAEGLSLANIRGAIPMSGVYTIPDHKFFEPIFGKDPAAQRDASPVAHVASQTPPFLLLLGNSELPFCDRPNAQAFYTVLKDKKCSVQMVEIAPRNHMSIMYCTASKETDPGMQRMLTFIQSQVITDRLAHNPVAAIDSLTSSLARYAAAAAK